MARANRHYIPGCGAIGREVMKADIVIRGSDQVNRLILWMKAERRGAAFGLRRGFSGLKLCF